MLSSFDRTHESVRYQRQGGPTGCGNSNGSAEGFHHVFVLPPRRIASAAIRFKFDPMTTS
jgi:hypothetical protein